jgi:hypothetical protein
MKNLLSAATAMVLSMTAPALFGGTGLSTQGTISFSANPANVADVVTVTAHVSAINPITGGTLVLVGRQDGFGNPVSCSAATFVDVPLTSSVNLAGTPPEDITTTGFTGAPGAYGYWAHFLPNNGDQGDYKESQSPCLDLIVNTGICTGGFTIAASAGTGNDLPTAGTTWTGSFVITVSNCSVDGLTGVSAQGGTSAWTSVGSWSSDAGSVGVRKQTGGGNQILLWTLPSMVPGQISHMTVNLSGKIKAGTPSLTQLNIDGAWSAQGTDAVTLTKVAAGYTSPILISVQ